MCKVRVWEEEVTIPTYPVGKPDKNPMFLEKRVYQGSSGKVYPHTVIDKIGDDKEDRIYRALYLENEYLKIMVLPELGGRIHRATDKTNGYDFVYYNHVIKPALVGLTGPWISGGIEFNWPQHHRPSTFDPVDCRTKENEDGSATIWVGETENMFRTKGMAGFTLRPGRSFIEISVHLYNPTSFPQTFLWWANPAVPVNGRTQSIFPPDVQTVLDHGRRAVSSFPIATGTYYKVDYSGGVDISRYANIPVPTSYMAAHSDYDFVGGYDYGREAGILHVADHQISPGKKQWTWGCGEFGRAWDRNLTDEDGPYVELMTGCFTDNQPDFSWLSPHSSKSFQQYFMPYRGVGQIRNATTDAAVGMEISDGGATVRAYTTGCFPNTQIIVSHKSETIFSDRAALAPDKPYEQTFSLPETVPADEITGKIVSADGRELVSWMMEKPAVEPAPEPAKAPPLPAEAATNEDLYLYGLHIEQYRHATCAAEDYYLEGLRRDPTDVRINNAYGLLLLRRGLFRESEPYFAAAVQKLTRLNANPYDSEPIYNLGLSLRYQGKLREAYDRFYKSVWSDAWQASGFYQLACIDCAFGDFQKALEKAVCSIERNARQMKARTLKTALLRHLGREAEATAFAESSIKLDPLDFGSRYERILLSRQDPTLHASLWEDFAGLLHGQHNTCLELAMDYMEAGLLSEAAELLQWFAGRKNTASVYPLIWYYLSFLHQKQGEAEQAQTCAQKGEAADSFGCFPHRLEDILVLEVAEKIILHAPKACYYLGNLWYDKKQYEKAIACWERSAKADGGFPTVHRNLALAYYNKRGDAAHAQTELELAYQLDPADSRVLMELDQLYKKTGVPAEQRLSFLKGHLETAMERDDLALEIITLLNLTGRHEEAYRRIITRKFHPWEGGEGKVPAQYLASLIELAKQAMQANHPQTAINLLEQAAGPYPHNLGEGKLFGAQENHIYYFLGCAYEKAGNQEAASRCYQTASVGLSEPAGMMYYNDQPPETIFYQGLGLRKLGREEEALERFHKLIQYGEAHYHDDIRIDYFAVSLPDLLIFDEDLNRKNRIHCGFLMGLGALGLRDRDRAFQYLLEAQRLDPSHLGIQQHLCWEQQNWDE